MQIPSLSSFLGAVPVVLGGLVAVTPAHAEAKAQKAATAAFRDCLEMEEFGDATPCWRRYLDKHRAAGNEGEIVLAEERVAGKQAPKGTKQAAPPPEPPAAAPEPEADEAAAEEPAEAEESEEATEEEPEADEQAEEEEPEASAQASSDELAGLGLTVQAHGSLGAYFLDQFHYAPYGAISTPGSNQWARQIFALPEVMYGGGLAVDYRVTKLSEMDFSVRAGADFFMGNGTAVQAQLISIEVLGALAMPLGPIRAHAGLGPALSLAKVRAVPYYENMSLGVGEPPNTMVVASMPGQIVDYTNTLFGLTALVGASYELVERLDVRLEVPLRFHLPRGYDQGNPPLMRCPTDFSDPTTLSAEPDQDSRVCWGFDQREDTFASVGVRLGLGYAF